MRRLFFGLMLLFWPLIVGAETVTISESTKIHFIIPQGWQLAETPPQPLVDEMAEHIGHDATAKGYTPTAEQLDTAARKRLAANEVLLYNPQSMAYMTFDFSPLRQGENAPNKNTIRLSAIGAGESLEQEEEVTDVKGSNRPVSVNGAFTAHRYDADYKQHDEKIRFSGIVGFSHPYWFYLYFSDRLRDPLDQQRAEEVFSSVRIETK